MLLWSPKILPWNDISLYTSTDAQRHVIDQQDTNHEQSVSMVEAAVFGQPSVKQW